MSCAVSAAPVGDVLDVQVEAQQATIRAEGGWVRITFPTPDIVRIHASRTGNFPVDSTHPDFNGPYYIEDYSRPPMPVRAEERDDRWVFEPDGDARCAVEIGRAPFYVRVFRLEPGASGVVRELRLETQPVRAWAFLEGRTDVTFAIADGEHYIGLGADRHPLDMRGHALAFETNELGSEKEGGGFPVPWVMSSRGYGIFLNNVDPATRFDLGKTNPGEFRIEARDGGREGWDADLYVIVGDDYADLMSGYIGLTGKPILPEKWFFGNLQSKCCDWRARDVTYIAARFHELGLPLDGMILDLQWREVRPDMWRWTPAFDENNLHAGRQNLEWAASFGDFAGMVQVLDQLGVKFGLHENATSTYSDDARGAGPFLGAALPDVSRPEVAGRLWQMHAPRVVDGADFWWQDQGERIDTMGANGYPMKNLNGSLWAKLVVEGMREAKGVSVPVLSRSGPVGGHRYISPWPGDVPAGLDYASVDLDFIRNGGLAGYAAIGADMGGFYRGHIPDLPNEIRRIADMLLVFPVIRTHGADYKLPWMFSGEAASTYARYLQLRYRLLPYIYSAAIEAHETGRPILAPLCFDHPADEATYRRDHDFLLGRDLLVAPVIDESESREVYLPAGGWRNFWSDERYAGGSNVTVPAPLVGGRSLPVFVRDGAIVPMVEPALTTPSAFFGPYTFHLYPASGRSVERTFHDRARALESSRTMTVGMADQRDRCELEFTGAGEVGVLYLHGLARPDSVAVDGILLAESGSGPDAPGWSFGPSDFPLQESTTVLKVVLPEKQPGGDGPVHITIRKQAGS